MAFRLNDEQKQFMIEFVPGHSYKEVAAEFTARFGVEYTAKQVKYYCADNKIKNGLKGKMTNEQYELCKGTMFKPGTKPRNTDPVGTEKVLSDGYVWVKINDVPGAKKQVNWKQKHRLIYEQKHGPIPEGCLVKFLDGDKRNLDPNNLQVVTKAVNGVMNKHGFSFDNKELTKTGIAIAELKMAKHQRTKKGKKKHE